MSDKIKSQHLQRKAMLFASIPPTRSPSGLTGNVLDSSGSFHTLIASTSSTPIMYVPACVEDCGSVRLCQGALTEELEATPLLLAQKVPG